MSEFFTKKDAEEFKEDFQHFLNVLFSGNQPKLRQVIDLQMNLKQMSERVNLLLTDKIRELYDKILTIIKEHGNLVVAQIHIN